MSGQYLSDDWVTPFGTMFVLAGVVMWGWARRNARNLDVDTSHIDLLVPLSIFLGIAGASLLTLLVPEDREIAGDALSTWLRIRFLGIAFCGAVVVFIYSRAANFSFRSLLDILAVPTVAGLLVHRIGCLFAGCCWGDIAVHSEALTTIANGDVGRQVQTLDWLAGDWVITAISYGPGTLPFLQQQALGLIAADAQASLPVHPVQAYDAALLLVLILFARRLSLTRLPRGTVAAFVAAGYALIRFLTEFVRADSGIVLGDLTMPQLQCALILAAASVALIIQPKSQNRLT